ncbi:cuticle collagen 19-like [Psammomys obesus]|uniref:cuticle collagen 19-like n=1 Tax=Psammomys obesus TaxID=48139 RepID=UPI002452C09D|nr:cuticle collagen 19-like [Psammomys obesus]
MCAKVLCKVLPKELLLNRWTSVPVRRYLQPSSMKALVKWAKLQRTNFSTLLENEAGTTLSELEDVKDVSVQARDRVCSAAPQGIKGSPGRYGTGRAKHRVEHRANGSVLPGKFLLGDACEAPPRRGGVSGWAESKVAGRAPSNIPRRRGLPVARARLRGLPAPGSPRVPGPARTFPSPAPPPPNLRGGPGRDPGGDVIARGGASGTAVQRGGAGGAGPAARDGAAGAGRREGGVGGRTGRRGREARGRAGPLVRPLGAGACSRAPGNGAASPPAPPRTPRRRPRALAR